MSKKFSELDRAVSLNNGDLFALAQVDAEAETGYRSVASPVSDVAQKILKNTSFPTDLNTKNKNVIGAINEIDEIVYEDLPYPNLWTDTDESYTGTGVSWSRNNQDYVFVITVAGANKGRFFKLDLDVSDHIGEDITISAILANYNTAGTPTVRFNCLDSENNSIYGATEYQFTLSTSQRKSKTMPIPQGAKYVVFGLYSGTSSSAVGKTWTVSNIQIEWGDQATEYHVKGDYKASKIKILEDETEDLEKRVDKLEKYHFPYEYNERIFTSGRFRDCYNPYKDGGSLQLKGQMHCHCTSNDGTVLSTPAQIYNNYKLLYDFMVLTDYSFTTDFARFDELVDLNDLDPEYDLIQLCKGYELKVIGEGSVKQYHLIIWNPDVIVAYNAGTKPQNVINEMTQKGCVVDFPHPTYSNYSARDMMNIDAKFIEVISGTSLSEDQWDALLSAGKLSFGMGVSDCHGTSIDSIDSAWIKVFSNQKNREEIFKSLLAGNFYASNGATINKIEIVDNDLIIDTGDPLAIVVFTKENGTVLATETGAVVSYSFAGNEKYVRAKITLSDSSIAWTQPIFFSDEIKPINKK